MPGFDPTRVNVTVVHGVVFLMGMVSPQRKPMLGADVARNISGIDKVVKVFEYTD